MSHIRLLEGEVEADDRDARIADLEADLQATKSDLRRAQQVARDAQANAAATLAPLRRQLTPLYRALQSVFGELDAAGVSDLGGQGASASAAPQQGDARVTAVWASWKEKLSPACGKVIDALLLHGELNSVQIKVAARLGTSTVSDSISKLNKAGLINKNGGRFSLKAL